MIGLVKRKGTDRQACVCEVSKPKNPITLTDNGRRYNPSVINESNNPALSKYASGTIAESRLALNQIMMSHRAPLFILDMPDSLLKKCDDMRVIHAVMNFLSIPARPNNTHLPQTAHVV